MKKGKIEKIKKMGFDVSDEGKNGEWFISMQSVPSKETILKLLKLFSFEECICFWDNYHDTISDPGGYVSAYVLNKDRAVFMEGNHGWSSDFESISLEELAEMMISNWDKDCDDGIFLNRIQIRPHHNSQKDLYLYNI